MPVFIQLTPLENPYKNEKNACFDLWASILIQVNNYVLIDWQWNIITLIEWHFEHRQSMMHKFPVEYEKYSNLSLAEIHDLIGNKITDESDIDFAEKIGEELQEHFGNKLFYISGTPTLHFFIGLDNAGMGEISFRKEEQEKYISLKFDMQDFIFKMESEINKFLKEWKEHFFSKPAYDNLLNEAFSTHLHI